MFKPLLEVIIFGPAGTTTKNTMKRTYSITKTITNPKNGLFSKMEIEFESIPAMKRYEESIEMEEADDILLASFSEMNWKVQTPRGLRRYNF